MREDLIKCKRISVDVPLLRVRSRWLDISRVLFFAFFWTGIKKDAYIRPSWPNKLGQLRIYHTAKIFCFIKSQELLEVITVLKFSTKEAKSCIFSHFWITFSTSLVIICQCLSVNMSNKREKQKLFFRNIILPKQQMTSKHLSENRPLNWTKDKIAFFTM